MGDAIPSDCTADDYGSNGFPVARPECAYVSLSLDLRNEKVVIWRFAQRVMAVPALTSSGDLASGVDTPAQMVDAFNSSIDSTLATPVGETGTVYGDYVTDADVAAELVGQDLIFRSVTITTPEAWTESYTISGSTATLDWTKAWGDEELAVGEIVVLFPGPVSESNGTVDGNTVTWPVTGTERSVYLYAVATV